MSKTVAIIDDEAEMEFIYSVMLDVPVKKGLIDLKFFSDSEEFFTWFQTHRPDLILSDINMPNISGPDILRRVRNAGRSIPTYLVSGYEESNYRQIIQDLEVRRFLTKPLNFNKVCTFIELDLGLRSANL
ncbi:MAG TPA: response regulator [Bacteriovoracaceae bacterium]|nr:response regulator [Bacteriovoracaceae bacterium]